MAATVEPVTRADAFIADEWAEICEAFHHAAGHSGMRARAVAEADAVLDLWLELRG